MTSKQEDLSRQHASANSVQRLVVDLEEVLRALRSRIPEEWFTLELTMPQVRALFALLRNGDSRMGTLASHLGVSLSSATGLVDRLVEKRLVERWVDPEDRRSVLCRLADDGRELAEKLLYIRRNWWEDRLSQLTEAEACQAQEGLRSLLNGLERLDAEDENPPIEPPTSPKKATARPAVG